MVGLWWVVAPLVIATAAGAVGHLRQALFDQFVDRYFPGPWPMGSVSKDVAAAHARLALALQGDPRLLTMLMSARS